MNDDDEFPFKKDPKLDWSLTPKNIILQLLVLILFLAAIYVMYLIVSDTIKAIMA